MAAMQCGTLVRGDQDGTLIKVNRTFPATQGTVWLLSLPQFWQQKEFS